MNGLALAIRIGLALVMAVAGAAKLADRAGARQAVTDFGVSERLAGPVAWFLPAAELTAALLLLVSATARAGATLALVLLLAFSAAIARSILRGEAPDCHCFGTLHSEPAGPRTLARNLVLAGLAATVVAVGPGTSATTWVRSLNAGWGVALLLGIVLAAALAGGGAFVLRLLRRNGELLLRIDALEEALTSEGVALPPARPEASPAGLAVGSAAPEFELPDLSGRPVTLADLRSASEGHLMIVFSDPGCGPCSAMMPRVADWQRERPGGLRTVVVSRGGRDAHLAYAAEHGVIDLLVQRDREVSRSFEVSGTPSAVLIGRDGTVASTVHTGEDQIATLVASRAAVRLPVEQVQPVPPSLRTLDGEATVLSDHLRAARTLVVFWNPACGFCERMLDELREIDAARRGDLVVVSAGDAPTNRAMGLRAPILLDDGFTVGTRLGVAGTPSALLLDRGGSPVSEVAVGSEAVIALAGGERALALGAHAS